MDAILGRDDRLVAKLADVVQMIREKKEMRIKVLLKP